MMIRTMKKLLPLGKLEATLLKKLIKKLPTKDRSIVIPPGIGLDAAGVKIGGKLVAITTDPITFSTNQIGTYSVAININDVACLGCKPRWYSACLLLPPGITEKAVVNIWNNLAKSLASYNIIAIGGHVEITSAVKIPLIIGQMIGEVIGNSLLNLQNGRSGDQILLWRGIAIEGTAILATELCEQLNQHLPKSRLKNMQKLLYKPGICIWPLVEKIVPTRGLVGLHDPTEGGIATALHEIADACGCGLKIQGDVIPILQETKELAKLLKFDPLGLLASGSLLIVCRKNAAANILAKAKQIQGAAISIIGELTSQQKKTISINGNTRALPRYNTDEIIKCCRNTCKTQHNK